MRIDSLWIDGYKNFEDFKIDFQEEYLVNILLGKNGTGKSNVIEIIVNLFKELDNSTTPKVFFESFEYSFEIIYYITTQETQRWFLLRKELGKRVIITGNTKNDLVEENEISFAELKRLDKSEYLPKYVIAYYSGESTRLKEIFRAPEQSYYKLVEQNKDQEIDFRRFFYADAHHCQILLIALFAFANTDDKIKKLLEDYLGFEEFIDFTITLKSPDWNQGISLKEGVNLFWGAKGTPHRFCNYLYSESTGEPVINFNSPLSINNKIRESISLYLSGKKFVSNAVSYFKTGIDLFRHLESTFISGLIGEIVIRIKKNGSEQPIPFVQLSEGEQQLITIIGLLLFTSFDNTLFLLDEPDTHLNPNWQRDYLGLFKEFTSVKNSHIIISTHSPLLVQAAKDSGLILLKLEDGHPISNSDSHFIKNWRIDQVLTSEYFELVSSRPPELDEYMITREKILSKPKLDDEDITLLKSYENTFGVLPTGETIDEIKALQLINRLASKIPDKEHD
jgi:predicted ATPase